MLRIMEWNPETARIFEGMIDICPPEYKTMARYVISSLAEKYAKTKGDRIIQNPDMVNAFMEGVPGPFQADMKAGLKKFGLLPREIYSEACSPPPPPKQAANKAANKAAKKNVKKMARKS